MSQFLPLAIQNPKWVLQEWLKQQNNVFEFSDDDYSSLLICQILMEEIGGPNDSLSRYIYDVEKKQKINKKDLIITIGSIESESSYVVQITLPQSNQLGVTLSYLREVMQCDNNKIIISPSHIARFLRSRGVTPVFVVPWVQQILFSTFDVKLVSAGDQLWVLRNNDIYLYSKLVAEQKIIFQSSHDIVGHIAGTKTEGLIYAAEVAAKIHAKLQDYFGDAGRGNLPSHLLPFLIGLFLDDLTQPPNYFSLKLTQAIDAFLVAMDELEINPQDALVLTGFPSRINTILQITREKTEFSPALLKNEIKKLLAECKGLITVYSH